MKVKDCMTRDVRLIGPDATIAEAARAMGETDCGALPVASPDRLLGMITDRDICIRAVAQGRAPDTPVRDIMSKEVMYCYDDETADEVLENMGDIQVRRLPVVDRHKRLVGIVALSDLASGCEKPAGEALCLIARTGGSHTQSLQ
jgi:CBS domain-containing protein